MAEFFQSQIDYIFFTYGLGFLLLGVTSFTLGRRGQSNLPWRLLGLFGITHGSNEWLDLVALSAGDSPTFKLFRLIVMAVSFVFLLEFARTSTRGWVSKPLGLAIYFPLVLALAAACVAWGQPSANAMARYLLGLVAGLWSGINLIQYGRKSLPDRSGWLASAGITMALYGVAAGAIVPTAPFPPATLVNHETFLFLTGTPIQLWRGLLACWPVGLLDSSIRLGIFAYGCGSGYFVSVEKRKSGLFSLDCNRTVDDSGSRLGGDQLPG